MLPLSPPPGYFKEINSIISKFIWNDKCPRIKLTTLQHPNSAGGLAVPNFELYYWSFQLKALHNWVDPRWCVHITEDLTWSAHTDAVLKKAHQRLFFLRRLRKFGMSPSILRSFYTCTVESILTGCITAWLETAPLATAKLCKGSCELPATLLEVSFPPSRTSTPGGV